MRKLLFVIGVSLLAFAGRANAGLFGGDRIELRPPAVTVERLEPEVLAPARMHLPPLPAERVPFQAGEFRGPISLQLPEMGPEGLDLEIRSGRFLFAVSADVVDGRSTIVMSPRLDCDTRETYFAVRLQCDVTSTVAVYAESFQAAGAILGCDHARATQGYVWDGLQLQAGLRWQPGERVTFEGGPVFYVFSATGAASGVGGRFGVRIAF